MSTPKLRDTALVLPVVCLFSDEQTERVPPDSFLVLKYGKTRYTKGETLGEYEFTPADADRVIADFAERDRAVVIDWEHQTLTGNRAPAAGWIESLQKTADGVVAKLRSWTAQGLEDLKAGAYRYFSPVLTMTRQHPISLHSVGLTNHAATHSPPALVASDDTDIDPATPNQETVEMEHLKAVAAALGIEPLALADDKGPDEPGTLAAVTGRIAELRRAAEERAAFLKLHDAADLGAMTGKIRGMVPAAELTALNDRLALIDAEKAVAAAFADRKLVEAQRGWALDYARTNPAQFAAFVAGAPQIAPPATPVALADSAGDPLALTDDAMKRQFERDPSLAAEGLTLDSYKALRRAEARGAVRIFNPSKTAKE